MLKRINDKEMHGTTLNSPKNVLYYAMYYIPITPLNNTFSFGYCQFDTYMINDSLYKKYTVVPISTPKCPACCCMKGGTFPL